MLKSVLVAVMLLSLATVVQAEDAKACFVTESTGTCGPDYAPSTITCPDGTSGPSYVQTAAPETSKCANALAGAGGKKECNPSSVEGKWFVYGCGGGTWSQIAEVTKTCRASQLTGDECTGPKPAEPQPR